MALSRRRIPPQEHAIAEVIDAPTTTHSPTEPAPKRFGKRGWIILDLAASEKTVTASHTALVDATAELDETRTGALAVYTESGTFVAATRPELVSDLAAIERQQNTT